MTPINAVVIMTAAARASSALVGNIYQDVAFNVATDTPYLVYSLAGGTQTFTLATHARRTQRVTYTIYMPVFSSNLMLPDLLSVDAVVYKALVDTGRVRGADGATTSYVPDLDMSAVSNTVELQ